MPTSAVAWSATMKVTDIIDRLGGAATAAQTLGQNRTTVCMWRVNGRLPPRHVPAVAAALGVPADAVWPATNPQPQQAAA